MEHGAKAHLKHLTEYFNFFNEFIKMGEEEIQFLISVESISTMVNFYLGQKSQDYVSISTAHSRNMLSPSVGENVKIV